MIEGLKFRVPGEFVRAHMVKQARAAEVRAAEERKAHAMREEIKAKMGSLHLEKECEPVSVDARCIGRRYEELSKQFNTLAGFIDTSETYILSKQEIDCLMQEDGYEGYWAVDAAANTRW